MNAIVPIPRVSLSFRVGTVGDLPFMDSLQKQHGKALGYFTTKQYEGYIAQGAVLIAEEGNEGLRDQGIKGEDGGISLVPSLPRSLDPSSPKPLGYIISRDRYLQRDELGVIFQLCVVPDLQRNFVGAALVQEVFKRSEYGCRLYCLWCAQDLSANHFWESLGFVPLAFRAGSDKKRRVHIFWQKRIVDGDRTRWWYPSRTRGGAIGAERLVFPIPPGVHWRDVQPVELPALSPVEGPVEKRKRVVPAALMSAPAKHGPRQFDAPPAVVPPVVQTVAEKPKREKKPKPKIDPQLVAKSRELRDRWMERLNESDVLLTSAAKYDVSRALPAALGRELPVLAA